MIEIAPLPPRGLEEVDKELQEMVVSRIKQAKDLKIGERARFIIDAIGKNGGVEFKKKNKKEKLVIEYGGEVIRWKGEIVYYRESGSIIIFTREKEWLENFNACYETAKRLFAEKLKRNFSE